MEMERWRENVQSFKKVETKNTQSSTRTREDMDLKMKVKESELIKG